MKSTPKSLAYGLRLTAFAGFVIMYFTIIDERAARLGSAQDAKTVLKQLHAAQTEHYLKNGRFALNLYELQLTGDKKLWETSPNFVFGLARTCYASVGEWRAASFLPDSKGGKLDGEILHKIQDLFMKLGACANPADKSGLELWAIGDLHRGEPFDVLRVRADGAVEHLAHEAPPSESLPLTIGNVFASLALLSCLWLVAAPPAGTERWYIILQVVCIFLVASLLSSGIKLFVLQ